VTNVSIIQGEIYQKKSYLVV